MKEFDDLVQTVSQLRAPEGCPWDKAQTHQSLRPYLIEETYEAIDVLDKINSTDDLKNKKIAEALKEELGDVLMQVMLHAEMASEVGAFTIRDILKTLDEKLIRRHPHVFGDEKADSAEAAFQNWEKEKAKEKSKNPNASILDGVPTGLPALLRTSRVLEKVTKVGFQWKDLEGPLAKIDEELAEFKEAAKGGVKPEIESELGDLLFTVCNVGYLLKVSPEDSLREMLNRFQTRFFHIEKSLKLRGKKPEESSLEEMDQLWNEAKELENKD